MANIERGELALVVKGDPERQIEDREYTLKLSTNAAVQLEQKLKKSLGQLLAEAGQLNFEAIRYVTWLLLQKYHSKDFKTQDQAGDLIDEMGGVARMFDSLRQLAALNQPKPEKGKKGASEGGDDVEDPSRAQG